MTEKQTMKEISVYVATDSDGVILEVFLDLSHLIRSLRTWNYEAPRTYGDRRIRPDIHLISVFTTEGIIGKHWEECDLFMRRLRECTIEKNSEEWVAFEGSSLYNEEVNPVWGNDKQSFDSLSSALRALVTLPEEQKGEGE